ncbi:MAG: hypothetical protein IJP77_07635 [Bacteroidales bacterium]|nr:hypothetical protein [Bacteroidales bacterium]
MKTVAFLLAAGLAVFSAVGVNPGAYANTANPAATIAAYASQVQDTMVPGKLYFVNLQEGEQPILTALSLFGNRCGSESFNHKPYSTDGIRAVFELDEWIEFHPQASAASGIRVMVFIHKTDQGFYLQNPLNDETPGYILECSLNKDPDQEDDSSWGSFYLHPEEVDPGYYDFVFIYKDKVFATLLTHFFQPEEIFKKTDSALEQLMSQRPF